MKPILTQINQQQIDWIKERKPQGEFEIDILFTKQPSRSINLEPATLDSVISLFATYQRSGEHPSVELIKDIDQFLLSKGFIGKRLLAKYMERHENGDTFLGTDLYAIELFKEPIDRQLL